ncbi:hypothetical protein L9F63_015388, partial [Diploptera punctata]
MEGICSKDVVHKCHSDPGSVAEERAEGEDLRMSVERGRSARVRSTSRHRPTSGSSARKCILTLDGYSYVI